MKKLLFILPFILLSCSNDEDSGCICKKAKFTTAENPTGHFYITNLPIDCTTRQPFPKDIQPHYFYMGCESN